mmetsp:Transcript_52543/g.162682  ORF Transcript_52543/g.162682 Transcript_52543/m.162682 type:complete len:256 (+) Transcript_52543:544-1311(+)
MAELPPVPRHTSPRHRPPACGGGHGCGPAAAELSGVPQAGEQGCSWGICGEAARAGCAGGQSAHPAGRGRHVDCMLRGHRSAQNGCRGTPCGAPASGLLCCGARSWIPAALPQHGMALESGFESQRTCCLSGRAHGSAPSGPGTLLGPWQSAPSCLGPRCPNAGGRNSHGCTSCHGLGCGKSKSGGPCLCLSASPCPCLCPCHCQCPCTCPSWHPGPRLHVHGCCGCGCGGSACSDSVGHCWSCCGSRGSGRPRP